MAPQLTQLLQFTSSACSSQAACKKQQFSLILLSTGHRLFFHEASVKQYSRKRKRTVMLVEHVTVERRLQQICKCAYITCSKIAGGKCTSYQHLYRALYTYRTETVTSYVKQTTIEHLGETAMNLFYPSINHINRRGQVDIKNERRNIDQRN